MYFAWHSDISYPINISGRQLSCLVAMSTSCGGILMLFKYIWIFPSEMMDFVCSWRRARCYWPATYC